ncbi:uncharacterized protein LOC127763946 [Oryza glaberrima]|uniref:uncharacterized protein LOC127763946 n=1 Tax=Oryza glaberrima TaxID=4538 RepID=UPI00224C5591|nr:uncharacterized protein LOC127763946 [Oryza glaberrima]
MSRRPSVAPEPAPRLVCNATTSDLPAGCNLGLLARIELLVLFCSAILALLVFLGSSRRRSSSATVRLVVWGAFTVSYPVAAYTIGLMQSSPFHHELFVVWSCFFLFVLASSDSITAYTLADIKSPATVLLNRGLQVIYVSVLLHYYSSVLSPKLKIYLFIVWLVSLGKIALSALGYRLALRSDRLEADNKLVADYMTYEHDLSRQQGGSDEDPVTMEGYKYVVRGEETDVMEPTALDYVKKIKVDGARALVTVESVWRCKGRLLMGSSVADASAAARRDLCLSFALFKLLRRRCSNYPLAESGQPKTRDFVLKGLLGQGKDDDDDDGGDRRSRRDGRAFRVIEVELGFLYDLFYTRYPFICHAAVSTAPHLAMCALVMTIGVLTLSSHSLRHYHPTHHRSIEVNGVNLDVALTMFIIALVIVLEAYQFVAVLFSDWQKVKMLCRYVLRPSWQGNPFFEAVLRVLCYCGSGVYWKKTMSQYSIVRHASPGHAVKDWLSRATRRWLDRLMFNGGKTRSVKVSAAVESALASALRDRDDDDGVLGGGGRAAPALRQHGLDWAWGGATWRTCAHAILIWHIATCLCDMQMQAAITHKKTRPRARKAAGGGDGDGDRAVATSLSRYCAYLVSSAPELLPEHQYTTRTIAEAVLLELRGCLRGCASDKEVLDRLKAVAESTATASSPESGIHVHGARLWTQLMVIPDQDMTWKLLARVWAELMLFVTPADNATAHVQHLTMGGELITHLWALLTHAGIVDRPNSPSPHPHPAP